MSTKAARAVALPGQIQTAEPSVAESELSRTEFERVRKLIYARAGISLGPAKHSMVFSRLMRRLRALGMSDFKHYLDMLESEPANGNEWQEFVNALTTNLTSFFREQHHFPILAEFAARQAAQGPVRIWCSAASTGEEPYSWQSRCLKRSGARRRRCRFWRRISIPRFWPRPPVVCIAMKGSPGSIRAY